MASRVRTDSWISAPSITPQPDKTTPIRLDFAMTLPSFHDLFHRFTNDRRIFHHMDPGRLQGSDLLVRCALSSRNDRSGMAHPPTGGGCDPCDKTHHGFSHMGLDIFGRILLGISPDLADQHNGLCASVFLKQTQNIHEIRSVDRIPTDTHAGGLSQTQKGQLPDDLIGQGAASGHHSYLSFFMNKSGHDSDLAFLRSDDPGTVGADQP